MAESHEDTRRRVSAACRRPKCRRVRVSGAGRHCFLRSISAEQPPELAPTCRPRHGVSGAGQLCPGGSRLAVADDGWIIRPIARSTSSGVSQRPQRAPAFLLSASKLRGRSSSSVASRPSPRLSGGRPAAAWADLGGGSSPNGHVTRTLEFDRLGRLYVSVGSQSNVDNDSFRARIRRFTNLQNAPRPHKFPKDATRPRAAAAARARGGRSWRGKPRPAAGPRRPAGGMPAR